MPNGRIAVRGLKICECMWKYKERIHLLHFGHSGYMKSLYMPSKKKKLNGHKTMLVQTWQITEMAFNP
jgi:hypothetical protein